ncbi:MAG: hypothetical protein FWF05_09465 [Oscillospiraceae bacterium]|nr:hypothetical protein [Oscillospiraceae bacterium]
MNGEILLAAICGGGIALLTVSLAYLCRPKVKKAHSPLEFSKRIFLWLSGLVGVITFFVFIMVWRTEDVSVTQSLIDNAFDLLKVGVVSYFGKAALENRVKLASVYPKLKNQIFNDTGNIT